MHLQDLRGFMMVAEDLSFTRAARRMYLSQPAMSRLVARLERDIGARLIDRSGGTITLTPAGEAMVIRGRMVLREADGAVTAIRDTIGRRKNTAGLRVGIFYPGAAELTAPIVTQFKAAYPNVPVRLVDITARGGDLALAGDIVDVALLWGPAHDAVEAHVLFTDGRSLITPRRHPLAGADCIPADLFDEPIPQIASVRQEWWNQWTFKADRGGDQARLHEVDTITDSLLAIAAGQAVGWGPRSLSRFSPVAGISYTAMPAASRAEALVACTAADRRPEVRAFVAIARHTAKTLIGLVPEARPPPPASHTP